MDKYTLSYRILNGNVHGCVFAKNRPVSLNWPDYNPKCANRTISRLLFSPEASMANSVDPDQTAPLVCSGPTLLASILNSSVMLGNYFKQTTSADDIFRCIFFLALLGLRQATALGVVITSIVNPI